MRAILLVTIDCVDEFEIHDRIEELEEAGYVVELDRIEEDIDIDE